MNDNDKYMFLLDEIKEQQCKVDEETAILKALERIISKYSNRSHSPNAQVKDVSMPTEYSNDLTLPEKIYVALLKIGNGNVHDVSESLMKLDGAFTLEKTLKDARNYLSKLYKKGLIAARKEKNSRRYIYTIKEKP